MRKRAPRLCGRPLLAGALLLSHACARDLEVLPDESCTDHGAEAVVAFRDPDLEEAVRLALPPGGPQALTCELLASVTILDAPGPQITDLAGAQNLTGLTFLVLPNSSVSALWPLLELESLRSITLDGSRDLTDIGPLVDNPGIGSLDLVYLRGTGVSCGDVAALSDKGATVFSDCGGA
jgi:hypothetical protein